MVPSQSKLGRQHLPGLEDLLDQQVAAAGDLAEPAQVTFRVGQAVRVVDPESVDQPFPEPADDLGVGFVEDLRELDPDAGQAC